MRCVRLQHRYWVPCTRYKLCDSKTDRKIRTRLAGDVKNKSDPGWDRLPPVLRHPTVLYIVTSHTYTPRTSGVSVTVQSAILRVLIWTLETQVGASLVWKSTWEKKSTQSFAVQESRASWTPSISQSSSRIHTALRVHPRCFSKCNLKVKQKKKKKRSLLAQTSPALQPLPLAFCQLPIVSGLSIWPRRRRRQTYRFPYVYVLRTLTWDPCGRKENTDGTAPAFGKCLALLGFKELVMEESTGS